MYLLRTRILFVYYYSGFPRDYHITRVYLIILRDVRSRHRRP